MRPQKKFIQGATSLFFFSEFARFAKRWRDHDELARAGLAIIDGRLVISNPRDVHALIMAGTRPDLLGYEHPDCDTPRNEYLDEMRRRFFGVYANAPAFVLKLLERLRKVATPARIVLDNCTYRANGNPLDVNTGTGKELAKTISVWTGKTMGTNAVEKQRLELINKANAFLSDDSRTKEALPYFEALGNALGKPPKRTK